MTASYHWDGMNEARNLLKGIIQRTDSAHPLMENIAAYGVSSTQTRIRDEKREPDGAAWAVYKDTKYAARKAKHSSGGLLEYSGMLIKSMASNAGNQYAEWGSNREYAARQHFGGSGVIGRKYLGISSRDSRVLQDLIRSYYEDH